MTLFGKDYRNTEVLSCEFMAHSGQLHALVCDTTQHLHILQYDPEDPASLSGQKLLVRSEFFSGKDFLTMTLFPASADNLVPLCGASDGSICTVLPVSESQYRTLYVIQQQIAEKEDHFAGLNPKSHRSLFVENVGRSVLDFELIKRFERLPKSKQEDYARRIGKSGIQELWNCLEYIEDSLGYL